MRVCVIFNPTAKGGKARHFRRHLDEFGADVALKPTASPGHARRLAAEAVGEGFDTIVAAGGDGTVNEVLNGLADAPDGLRRARLGVLPLGTVNVFAKEHGLPIKLRAAWETIARGRETAIDLPQAEFTASEGRATRVPLIPDHKEETGTRVARPSETWQMQRRCFAQLAGAGLDARAIELVSWELKKKVGPLAYVIAGVKAMREPHPMIHVTANGRTVSGEFVLLGNGRFYGGRLPFFPNANPRDGLLDVLVFARMTWPVIARYGLGFLTGR
ncbi:MAG: diacylglycerol kinase family lipid kinase, partial [Verrucomicrobia bacterium]|nr:diacylglycerol kinase family lipid kinase [Verrucomicrobiota bacterium]